MAAVAEEDGSSIAAGKKKLNVGDCRDSCVRGVAYLVVQVTRSRRHVFEARFGGRERTSYIRLSQYTVRGAIIGEDFEGGPLELVAKPTSDYR